MAAEADLDMRSEPEPGELSWLWDELLRENAQRRIEIYEARRRQKRHLEEADAAWRRFYGRRA